MADYAPAEAAQVLGIKPGTLRRWSQEFAPLLSPAAAASGPTVRRRYTDNDIAVLRHAQRLLAEGKRYGEVRAALGDAASLPPPVEAHPLVGEVKVIEPSDQAAALVQLVEAQRQIVEAQRALIAQQGEQVAALAAQLDQARQQVEETRADLVGQLAEARARWARLPRWVRWWFGGEE